MKPAGSLRRFKRSPSYYVWLSLFFLLLALTLALFYYASIKVAYVWRWFKVPQYFYYHEKVEIRTGIDGDVESITITDKGAVIRVRGADETETYQAPAENVQVSEGDMLFAGDVLASYERWRPGILLQGMWITLKVSIIATFFGIIIGIIGGLARISENPLFKWVTITYVEIIRGSPLFVQILIWYFVLGTLINDVLSLYGIQTIPAFWYGVAALACFAGAYVTEIVRAGIQSIHRGQMEAARSLGMSYARAMRHVILPQALRRILPPLAGQFISLIKDSALLGIIAIRELTKAAREIVTTSLQPFELYLLCGVLYLVITFALSMLLQYMERRMQIA